MKKLFNYALLAAALLVGVNVNAVNVAKVGTTEYPTIEAAFDAAQGTAQEPVTITMLADANFGTCRIDLSGKYIIWDLAGCTVGTADAAQASGFFINKGLFHITNTSDITANLTLKPYWDKYNTLQLPVSAVNDHAGFAIKVTGSTDPNEAYGYTTLTIDENINYLAENTTNPAKGGYAIHIEKTTETNNPQKGSFGVTVNVNAYIRSYYGAIFVSGNVQAHDGNVPEIYVKEKATLVGTCDGDSHGALGNGYAKWYINGRCEGADGIYIKAGEWNIDGATIVATSTNHIDVAANGDGTTGGAGSGIVIDSHEGYGNIGDINIANSTVISNATGGYAIEEVATQGGTKLPDINVESGTFVGGITTTEEERSKIVNEGTIQGGEWHNSDISQYIDKSKNTIIVYKDKDGKEYQVVVPIKDADWSTSIAAAAAQTEKPKYAKVDADEEVSNNTTVEFVRILTGKKVTVKYGAVLDAGTLMTEGNSQVIVEAGGTLIISGAQGAYTYDANSIVVETSEAKPGVLLINPAVVLNTTPKATVKFISKSYYNSNIDYQFQYFGTPMVGEVKSIKPDKDVQTSIELWNTASWEWNSLGILKADGTGLSTPINAPFGFYNMIVNSPESDGKVTYTITGNLIGNTTPEINLPDKWNAMANSYSGKIGAQALLDALKSESNLGKSIYVYTKQGKCLIWRAANELSLAKDLAPMAAFMLVNNTADNKVISLDYNNLVWTPATTSAVPGAPKASQIAKATINVNSEIMGDAITIAEDAMFTADFEDGCDAEKFDNQAIKFYVNADGEYDIYATDNLNNTFIGLMTTEAGKYTISFEDVTGNFDLVDNKTNARIAMAEGTTYEFLAEAGEDAYRFMVVEGAKAPTNTPATKAAVKATKALINDQIVINNGERFFNMLGTDVK